MIKTTTTSLSDFWKDSKGEKMDPILIQLISLTFGFTGIFIHALVERTWLKWSLIGLDIVAYLIVGYLIVIYTVPMH